MMAVCERLSDLLRNPTEQRHVVRYTTDAPDTQNRQYALMQQINACHDEGFESGLRAWELDVGEWDCASGTSFGRCSQVHSDDEKNTDFLWKGCSWVHTPTVPLFCNGGTLPETLGRIRPCQLVMERAQMMIGCK